MKKSTKRAVAVKPTPLKAADPRLLSNWTFLSNHCHVLLCLYRQPDYRLREVAAAVGITERMVQRIVVELANAGYLTVIKDGRRNRYVVNSNLRLRHPLEMQHTIGELLAMLG